MEILDIVWLIIKGVFTPIFLCFLYFTIYSFLLSLLASKDRVEQTADLCNLYSEQHKAEGSPNNRLNSLKYYARFFLPFLLLNLYIYVTVIQSSLFYLNREFLSRIEILTLFPLLFFYRYTYRVMAREYDIKKVEKLSPVKTIAYVYFKDSLIVVGNFFLVFNMILLIYPPLTEYIPNFLKTGVFSLHK